MKAEKIILAGGDGYLGRLLCRHLLELGREVVVLTRKLPQGVVLPCAEDRLKRTGWDGVNAGAWQAELEGARAVINLAGRTVNCRYHKYNRRQILESRILSTQALGRAVHACKQPPEVWLNSSTATIYRHAEDRNMEEKDGEIGSGFSVDVARQWEAAFFESKTPRTRKVALRTAMVMGPGTEGVFEAFYRLVRLGMGGTMGNGRQWVSWVHHEDFVWILEWLLARGDFEGVVNVAAPHPLPNREFMRLLRKASGMSLGLPTPGWLLQPGAVFLRTETELVLKSRRVTPGRLLAAGFEFEWPHWEGAVHDLVETKTTQKKWRMTR